MTTLHDTTNPTGGPSQEDNPCDVEAAIEAIKRPNQYEPDKTVRFEAPDGTMREKTVPDNEWRWLPKMDLPGFGEIGDECGEDVPMFCEHCADTWTVGHTCRRSTCPRCAQAWTREAATSLAAKLKATWAYRMASEPEHQFFHHLVIDIPEDWQLGGDPETIYWRTLDVVKQLLDAFGIAGVPIYHPFRGDDETPDDRGAWKERLFEGNEWNEVSDELEFDPHFHVLGVAPYVDIGATERIQSETGWPIHRVTQQGDSNISVGSDWDMARVAAYCLSHAGIYTDSNGDKSAAYHPRIAERPWRKDGWLDGNVPTIQEQTREQMDEIVRSVAPKVLGIEYESVACLREVPEGSAADGNLSLAAGATHYDGTGDGSGDGSSTSTDEQEQDDEGEVQLVKCEGRALHIRQAPEYINDPEWRESADKAPAVEEAYRRWKKERGIL